MYDRKTWIVLAFGGILISLNIYFSAENAKKAPKPAPAEEITSSVEAPEIAGELSVETLPPPTDEQLVVLETEKAQFTLTNLGAGIKFVELKKQNNVQDRGTKVQMNRHSTGAIASLVDRQQKLLNLPFTFKPEQSSSGKTAVYIAQLPSGLIVKKTFSLETEKIPGAPYFIKLAMVLENSGTAPVELSDYGLFLGTASPLFQSEAPHHTGFFWNEAGTIHFKDATKFKGGWFSSAKNILWNDPDQTIEYAGVTDQFFSTVLRPEKAGNYRVWAKPSQVILTPGQAAVSALRSGMQFAPQTLLPAQPLTLHYRIFSGPKENTMLRKLDHSETAGEGWGKIMQYGMFGFVSRPLNWLLNFLHNGIDNFSSTQSWGLSVIFLTIIVRLCIWPLHAKSTLTMKRMAKLQPKMAELKEKYADDPTKLNTEMMGMYRKYGINPLGGCLPMFVQIPIFFGFFKMLDYAVELRNQPFLWCEDLSQPDTIAVLFGIPINLLPIVMAGTSVIQMAMMPKTGDKMQQRIMMFMPLLFFFFCYNYASALALYWTTQNIFSIGQTWLMNKIPEPELVARKGGAKKSWVQRMAEKQAEMQKHQKQGGKSTSALRDVTPTKKKGPPRTGG